MIGFLITMLIIVAIINHIFKHINGVSAITAYMSWRKFKKYYNLSRFDVQLISLDRWEVTDYNDFNIQIKLNSKTERDFGTFQLLVNQNGQVIEDETYKQGKFIKFVTV